MKKIQSVQVWPTDPRLLKVLRHPTAGLLKDRPEGTSWPDDQFTNRRIIEGSLTKTDPSDKEKT